jgi:signal transduction histidine kinase
VIECLELVRPQADQQKVTLKIDCERSLTPVHGDRNRLKQLVLNLLTNAIKYNHEDGNVKISLQRDDSTVVLDVEDTGCGIPAESLPHIFERFYRVPDQEKDVKGTGLGLVIAKRIARNHNGDIEVESEVGKGSIFRLRLPIPQSSASS